MNENVDEIWGSDYDSAPNHLIMGSTKRSSLVVLTRFYRFLWLLMGIIGLVWGIIVGMTLAGETIVGPATAVTGTVISVGLMVTLLVAGREPKPTE